MNNEKAWNEKVNFFRKTVDRLGKKIDPKILNAVVGINLSGLSTEKSCEGHLYYGIASPWVNIIVANSEKILAVYKKIETLREKTLTKDGEEKSISEEKKVIWKEIHVLVKKKDKLLSKNFQKIIELLSKFYFPRQNVPYENRIIVKENYLGARLICQGFLLQESRNVQERREKLIEYQKEFSIFADFLKNIFLHFQAKLNII